MTALGVELPDGSVLFGEPWPFHSRVDLALATRQKLMKPDAPPAWLAGLTAPEYQRIMQEAS